MNLPEIGLVHDLKIEIFEKQFDELSCNTVQFRTRKTENSETLPG